MSQLSLNDILLIVNLFQETIEKENITINLGGLEPLLWHSSFYHIDDLVKELTKAQFKVNITTNGALLTQYANSLIDAGLSKLRVSIHSFDRNVYYRITGQDMLPQVLSNIIKMRKHNLEVSLNRTLLRGYTDDLPLMLDFIRKHDIILKLYDLLWTTWIANEWEKYYLPWQSVIKQYVLPITEQVSLSRKSFHRPRLHYYLQGGGRVEIKAFHKKLHENLYSCSTCPFKSVCQETIGSYVYINPDKTLNLCHHRSDISLDLSSIITSSHDHGILELRSYFYQVLGKNWKEILHEGNLIFYINSSCNYFCGFPNRKNRTDQLWCMSSSRVNRLKI